MEHVLTPSDRSGFEIAIICATRPEIDAVEFMFDQVWDHAYGRAQETRMPILLVPSAITMLFWHLCLAWERAQPQVWLQAVVLASGEFG